MYIAIGRPPSIFPRLNAEHPACLSLSPLGEYPVQDSPTRLRDSSSGKMRRKRCLKAASNKYIYIYIHLLLRKRNWKFFYEFFCKSWKRISSFFFFFFFCNLKILKKKKKKKKFINLY